MLPGNGSITATATAVAPRGNAVGPNSSHAAGANSNGAAQLHNDASRRRGFGTDGVQTRPGYR